VQRMVKRVTCTSEMILSLDARQSEAVEQIALHAATTIETVLERARGCQWQ
jgi:hypothetical protein